MNGAINKQPMYIKGDYQLIARYNRFDESVEIADLDCPDMGWTDYDPTQGCLLYTTPSPRDSYASR